MTQRRGIPGCVAITLAVGVGLACESGSKSSLSRSTAKAGAPEKPWSRADYNDPKGWWMNWKVESPPSYGVGTRFEIEHVAADGTKTMETLEVTSIRPQGVGRYRVDMNRHDGQSVRRDLPPSLRYTTGRVGYLTSRNAKLVEVTVPAGTFVAARVWSSEKVDGVVHELDEWLAPDLPVTIQAWSRRPKVDSYDPPPDAVIPLGNDYSRLVSIERK